MGDKITRMEQGMQRRTELLLGKDNLEKLQAADRLLETHIPTLFHAASTLSGSLRSPPSPRGEGFVRRYSFSTYACICSDNARKAAFSYRSLPHWAMLLS